MTEAPKPTPKLNPKIAGEILRRRIGSLTLGEYEKYFGEISKVAQRRTNPSSPQNTNTTQK